MNPAFARYLLGVAALAVICASLGYAAVAIRRRALGDWSGAPARLAESVIGLALLIGILELLGLVGWFELAPIVIACLLAGFAIGAWAGPPSRTLRRRTPGRAAVGLATGVAILGGLVVIAEWSALSIQSYDVGIRGFDSLWYHLPWAASFA
ncbi:MAG: hypothetical protein JO363_20210, partial [Solirubrobacterales bacterium]|nr:hypothetical protein [Solirubrobacterales bacterium]